MGLPTVNYVSILLAAALAWLFGAAYYGPLGRRWIEAQGKSLEVFKLERTAKGRLAGAAPFVLCFVAEVAMAYVFYGILAHIKFFTLRTGLISGAFIWFGFVLTTIAVNNAFAGRKLALTLIDAGHWLGVLLIIGGVVGWMGP